MPHGVVIAAAAAAAAATTHNYWQVIEAPLHNWYQDSRLLHSVVRFSRLHWWIHISSCKALCMHPSI
jgi:hypothetical protein